jgi:hypothetical protein
MVNLVGTVFLELPMRGLNILCGEIQLQRSWLHILVLSGEIDICTAARRRHRHQVLAIDWLSAVTLDPNLSV